MSRREAGIRLGGYRGDAPMFERSNPANMKRRWAVRCNECGEEVEVRTRELAIFEIKHHYCRAFGVKRVLGGSQDAA